MLVLSTTLSENAQVGKALLTGLRDRGLAVDRDCALVIDDGMRLRPAIDEVVGDHANMQRSHTQKLRNAWKPRSRCVESTVSKSSGCWPWVWDGNYRGRHDKPRKIICIVAGCNRQREMAGSR